MHIDLRLFGPSVALSLATLLPAQGYDPEQLVARRLEKLQSPFLKQADWTTDYDRALAAAAERQQLIFAYFTRSDAPSPLCTVLEEGPLLDPGFGELGKRAVLFAHITSRTPDEPHADLFLQKGGRGYPSIIILDAKGTPLARHPSSELTFEAFRSTHDTVVKWLALKERAEAGDKDVETELLLAELSLNKVPYDEATGRAARLRDVTPEQKEELSRLMVNLEFFWKVNSLGATPGNVYKNLLAMKQIGHIPTGDAGRMFWQRLSRYARDRRDADLYAESLEGMKKILGDDPRYARLFSEMERTLKDLRGGNR